MKKGKGVIKRICTAGLVSAAVVGGVSMPIVTSSFASQEVQAAADVEINATNFPDANFRKYVQDNADKNKDGKLSSNEASKIKNISLKNYDQEDSVKIKNLKGIEYFVELKALDCSFNKLSSLDLSKNIKLEHVFCFNNEITNLNVRNNTKLTCLYCSNNKLTNIDVSKNVKLKNLICDINNLSKLDISNNKNLEFLSCYNNKEINLDISNNKSGIIVEIGNNVKKLTILSGQSVFLKGTIYTFNNSDNYEDWVDFDEFIIGNEKIVKNNGFKFSYHDVYFFEDDFVQSLAMPATCDEITGISAGSTKATYETENGKKGSLTFTVKSNGKTIKNGWYNEGGFKYYKNGVAYTGWHKMGKAEGEKTEHWSYFGKDGKIYTGWKKMGKAEGEKTEHWSYFGDNGWLRTGWQKMATKANPDGKNAQHWSYFGANGWLRTGWQKMATKANPDGKNAQHWSYFGNNGWLRTGWQKMATSSNPDGKNAQHWSYFGANGWLRIGMQNMATSYNPDGNNKQHRSYFGGNGWLVVNKKFSLSGKNYSADGKGWVTEVKKTSTGNAGTTKAAATSGTYILNLNSKVFHKSNCVSVTRMSASNKKSFNGTRAQAIAQGYTPCHNCNP